MLWIPLDAWRDETPFGADPPSRSSEWVIHPFTLSALAVFVFMVGVFVGVAGLGIWILW